MNAAGLRSFTTNFVQHSFINLSYRGRPPRAARHTLYGREAGARAAGGARRVFAICFNHKLKFYS